jgi:uncharacterized GH25 family protein
MHILSTHASVEVNHNFRAHHAKMRGGSASNDKPTTPCAVKSRFNVLLPKEEGTMVQNALSNFIRRATVAAFCALHVCFPVRICSGQESSVKPLKSATTQSPPAILHLVRIVDEDDQPIEAASLTTSAYLSSGKNVKPVPKQIAPGEFQLSVPRSALRLHITVKADGRTPMIARWDPNEMKQGLADETVFAMRKGETISGLVRDEDGKPVENATVRVLATTPDKVKKLPYQSLYDYPVTTDKQGRWICDLLPQNMTRVSLKFLHEEYVSDATYGQTTTGVSVEQLREGKVVSVLKKGTTVLGMVSDADGKPIAGASVYQGSDRFGSKHPRTKTDAKGLFRFPNSRQGRMILTFYAKGFAPELKEVQVQPNIRVIRMKLKPGKTLTIHTVDRKGKPLAGVLVAADTWRDHRSLCDLPEPRRTNKEGVFVWNDAPADAIEFDILKAGFMDRRNVSLTPQDKPHVVTFARPLAITGSVVDSKSGKPIDRFQVVPGTGWQADDAPSWDPEDAQSFKSGKYDFSQDYPRERHYLRFDAVGYESFASRAFQSDEESVVYDVELKPTKPLAGIVFLPDGNRAQDAQVLINMAGHHVSIRNGRLDDARDVTFVTTDVRGRFSLPTPTEDYCLIFLHEKGIATATPDQVGKEPIKLRPWATISGTITLDGKPEVAADVTLSLPPISGSVEGLRVYGEAQTDEQGRYVLNRVPPDVQATVSQGDVQINGGTVSVTTKPGQSLTADFKNE